MAAGTTAGRVRFAVAGAAVFLASLVYGVWAYTHAFATTGEPFTATRSLRAAAVDVGLFSVFALHHSLFARTGLRNLVAAWTSPALERSVYVWLASLLFIALVALWQPVGGTLWHAGAPLSIALASLQIAGVVIVLRASAGLDVWSLAGVRQSLAPATPTVRADLVCTGLYGLVRHPIYLGWVLMVWTPSLMNGTRLVFAAISTLYVVLAIPFEERTLRNVYGDRYREYGRQVRWRMLPWVY